MLIDTVYGDQREAALFRKNEGVVDNDNEHTSFVEYWDSDLLVHRSVHVTIKEGSITGAIAGQLGG